MSLCSVCGKSDKEFFKGDVVLSRSTKEILKVVNVTRSGVVWCRKSWWWALFGASISFYTHELELL